MNFNKISFFEKNVSPFCAAAWPAIANIFIFVIQIFKEFKEHRQIELIELKDVKPKSTLLSILTNIIFSTKITIFNLYYFRVRLGKYNF